MKRILCLLPVLLLLTALALPALAETMLSIDQESYVVYAGKTTVIDSELVTTSKKTPTVVWSSSDPSIARVNASGRVSGVSAGTVTITASLKNDPSISASAQVEVRVPLKNVVPEQKKLYLELDGSSSQPLKCTFTPADAYWQQVIWESSDPSVATVDADGMVHAAGIGSCKLTGSTDDPYYKREITCSVTVGQVAAGLTLNKTETVLAVGKKLKLKPTLWPENNPKARYDWYSSDESIARVSGGTVTGVSAGTVTITCRGKGSNGYTAQCVITVNSPVKTLTCSRRKVVLAPGTTWQITTKLSPETATNPTLVWKSSRENIATVTQDGLITGVSEGTCKITVSTVDGSGLAYGIIVTVRNYDYVISDMGGMDVPEAVTYKGAQYYNLFSKKHKVKVVINGKRADLDWSTVDLSTFNPEGVHLTPIAQGEDTIVVDVHDLTDYFIHRSRKKKFSVYVTQDALTTQPGE